MLMSTWTSVGAITYITYSIGNTDTATSCHHFVFQRFATIRAKCKSGVSKHITTQRDRHTVAEIICNHQRHETEDTLTCSSFHFCSTHRSRYICEIISVIPAVAFCRTLARPHCSLYNIARLLSQNALLIPMPFRFSPLPSYLDRSQVIGSYHLQCSW